MAKPKWPSEAGIYLLVELYGLNVWLFTDVKSYQQALRCICGEEGDATAAGLTIYSVHKDGTNIFAIGVFDEEPCTLVHELAHATIFMCEHIGFSPADGDGEPFAYLQEYLYTKFIDHIYLEKLDDPD